ncbi:enoyl-CoA hydratase/carnithine racemase [Parvibaculum indicum]|uniref:enoyl-CoA hydratase n=1 Tax=Parvibaculum indicum TaxID=562969 RepID=UPI001420B3E3|nr:enoyl-CoA hydratase [Parvibaculum indicum]NIJ42565.1 enoyl-CoA hydratase/carnithine racemase [Parvibaculum indicum]
MSAYEDVLYAVEDSVAVVTLNRPDKLNAWTGAMEKSVKAAMAEASADEKVRVIVLTGAGRGFCAGADMDLLQKIEAEGGEKREVSDEKNAEAAFRAAAGPDLEGAYGGRFGFLMDVPKPVIAAINGPAAGLGLVVALYADMRFAATDAKFTTAFASRGLVAEHGVSWLLPHLVGPAHAMDLLMSARKFDGREAERIGLVNRSFDAEHFMDNVMDYARMLATSVSPRSMTVMKRQVWKAMFQDFNTALAIGDDEMQKSFASEDFKEGVAHFVEKRAANFTGR